MRPHQDLTSPVIVRKLRERFGVPPPPQQRPPLDELILTILSQNTNDRNRDRAYTSLRDRYPTWDRILDSSREELEAAISVAGLGPTKSRRIRNILQVLADREEGYLERLCRLDREEAFRRLMDLEGVGPKTAACVLLFSCGVAAFPVDTHIYRVARRLKILVNNEDRVKAHSVLEEYFRPEDYLEVHLNLITLGRRICRPRSPRCPECPLGEYCPSYREEEENQGGERGKG